MSEMEIADGPFNGANLSKKQSIQSLSYGQLRAYPKVIQSQLATDKWQALNARDAASWRYHQKSQFWVRDKKQWLKVSYAQYANSALYSERLAFAPFVNNDDEADAKKYATSENLQAQGVVAATDTIQAALPLQSLAQQQFKQATSQAGQSSPQPLIPSVAITSPSNQQTIELIESGNVEVELTQHTLKQGERLIDLVQRYADRADSNYIYQYNAKYTRAKPPKIGSQLKVPTKWLTLLKGRATNGAGVNISWQGQTSGCKYIALEQAKENENVFWQARLDLPQGDYKIKVSVDDAEHQIDIALTVPEIELATLVIKLIDHQGQVLADQDYQVTDQHGQAYIGKSDQNGMISLDSLPLGQCEVSLPNSFSWQEQAAQQHRVSKGQTLNQIAKQYGFATAEEIYQHSDNTDFRQLRDNPNLIVEGDTINIPARAAKTLSLAVNEQHEISLPQPPQDTFELLLKNSKGETLAGKRVVFDLGAQHIDQVLGQDGKLTLDITDESLDSVEVKIYADAQASEPMAIFDMAIGEMPPVSEVKGVQARCNALGHDCGIADGIVGRKTRAGVKSFQTAHQLEVDGIAGPKTKAKLQTVYGY
ncbi:peptidoglycan-binding protein [Catenovulum sp. SM1970]|uniref:peptidoglycan-binding protein n=1 Tax=Marinifaba aquimaris TaxID=2741323 RepID=UPI001573B05A|nr:peptidoglycan-binding protein [Marinifaba aquimaris]NTS78587.1 peptidoglycan-binding protein [Marinifaba aquimaris]